MYMRAGRRTVAVLATLALAVGAGAACTSREAPTPGPDGLTKVVVSTGFGFQGQDSYLFAGKEQGFFADAGIDLEIQPGKGTSGNLVALTSGATQFATLDITSAALIYDAALSNKGGSKDFVLFACTFQRIIATITARPDRGISADPKSLEGHKIAYVTGSNNYLLFPVYAKLAGIDASKIEWVELAPESTSTIKPLLKAGKVDAITDTVVGLPGTQAVLGAEPVMLPYDNYLTDPYSNGWATTPKIMAENRGLVQRFHDAALKSLSWALAHPEQAAAALETHTKYPAANAVPEMAQMQQKVFINGDGTLGQIDPVRAKRAVSILQGAGLITNDVDPSAYTDFDMAVPVAYPDRPATGT